MTLKLNVTADRYFIWDKIKKYKRNEKPIELIFVFVFYFNFYLYVIILFY
jgi:hypothetical protein